jgi:hypothetical protein
LTVPPGNVGASGTPQITATVRALTGTTVPTGTVNFYLGNETLGTVPLSNGAVTFVMQARNLPIGSNSIIAAYAGNASFTGSTSVPVAITVTAPVATSIAVTASPAAFAQSSSTVLTARVKAGSGSSGPAGSIVFALGNLLLGAAPAAVSGITGTAVLTVRGSSLALGANVIMAIYASTDNFAGSSSSVGLNVTAPPTATMLTVTAGPGGKTATTLLTVTVKVANGTLMPTGSVTFALGGALLGSAVLATSGASATGAVILNNASLGTGTKTIIATFPGSPGFGGSTASVTIAAAQAHALQSNQNRIEQLW